MSSGSLLTLQNGTFGRVSVELGALFGLNGFDSFDDFRHFLTHFNGFRMNVTIFRYFTKITEQTG